MKRKRFLKKLSQFSLFAEKPLILLVSVVTLLLQLISFATTWNGSKIYLEGIFPYASLFFAVAVQATAYFFSNSLRRKVNILKLVALFVALCCSTYYSYIGIYNSVNSPVTYLQERYVTITRDLTQAYEDEVDATLTNAQEIINNASSLIITHYTELAGIQQNITNCRTALENIETSYTDNMRAPSRYSYENYEDYAAAYQAYIETISQGGTTENEALRSQTLSAFGYGTMETLNQTEQTTIAQLNTLQTALGATDNVTETVSMISMELSLALSRAGEGIPFTSANATDLNRLLQAAGLCGFSESGARLSNDIRQCADAKATVLMRNYTQLVSALPAKTVTDANTMELKSLMDAEILSASLKLNSLLPASAQISLTDAAYEITDLYLIPIKALQDNSTKTIAFFCLSMAALVDTLSVLFALSTRPKNPLWKRRLMLGINMDDYESAIYASLPGISHPVQALESFLAQFIPSPETEGEGYMLKAELNRLSEYQPLAALLCQLNLGKIIPAGYLDNDTSLLLLKARFVLWTNNIIYEERKEALYE